MISQVLPIEESRESTGQLWGIVLGGGESSGRPTPHPEPLRLRRRHTGRAERRRVLLHQTIERASRLIPRRRLVAVLARGTFAPYGADLPGLPGVLRLVEPRYRGSAAEIFLAVLRIVKQDRHALVAVLPSDQLVHYEARFMSYVAKAAQAAALRPEIPVMLGAHPLTPSAGYPWIEAGGPIEGLESFSIRAVKRVVQDPTPAEAEALWEGDGLVSTSVIVASARTLIELGQQYLPDVLETLEPLERAFGAPEEALLCEALWEEMPYASISRELMHGGEHFGVLPIPEVLWKDCVRPALHGLAC